MFQRNYSRLYDKNVVQPNPGFHIKKKPSINPKKIKISINHSLIKQSSQTFNSVWLPKTCDMDMLENMIFW